MKPFCAFIICLLCAVICWLSMNQLRKEKPATPDEFQVEQIRLNHSIDARLRKLESQKQE